MKAKLLIVCLGLIFLVGCSESQMKKTDAVVQQGQAIGAVVTAVSPAIPPPFGEIIGGVALLVSVLAGAWQTYRKGKLSAAFDDLGVAGATTNKTSSILDPANPILGAINPATVLELKALGH